MYGTFCPFTLAVAASAGTELGSASGTNVPAVFLYAYETTVGAKQSGGLEAARPKAVIWHRNGSCCLPEKPGPLTEWSMTSSDAADHRPAEATIRLRPITKPVTSPSRLPSDCAWKLDVTSWPSEVIRTSAGLMSLPTSTRTSTSPPLTNSGRGLDTVASASRRDARRFAGAPCAAAVDASTSAISEPTAKYARSRPTLWFFRLPVNTNPVLRVPLVSIATPQSLACPSRPPDSAHTIPSGLPRGSPPQPLAAPA